MIQIGLGWSAKKAALAGGKRNPTGFGIFGPDQALQPRSGKKSGRQKKRIVLALGL